MRFSINLATKTYLDQQLVRQIFGATIIVLLALMVQSVVGLSWDIGELQRLRGDIASFDRSLNSRPAGVSEQEYGRLQNSIRFYNAIIERKTYSWLGLLERLELATPEGIALAALVPDIKTGDIKIEGRAKSFPLVRAYLEKLEDSKQFTRIMLVSHQDIALGEKTRGVQFVISCQAVLK